MIKIRKNAHTGQRCYVVAGGPSTKNQDLAWLENEIVITVNQSHRVLNFDPTYICIGDRALWPVVKESYAKKRSLIIASTGTNGTCGSEYSGSNLAGLIDLDTTKEMGKDGFVYDLKKSVRKGWNVITEIVLPFVCWCGFSECYLLGCDCTNSGYAYESDRAKFQAFDSRTMKAYKTISKTKHLPTKIYNATDGGNLNVFPRKKFPSFVKDLLVVGYYTPDRNYKELAHGMKKSVEDQGLQCEVFERPSLAIPDAPKPMSWVLNCGQCAAFIRDMQKRYPDSNLLYLDADAIMSKSPELLLTKEFDYDFAAPYVTNKYITDELQSNTLYFRASHAARSLAIAWKKEQEIRKQNMLAKKYKPPFIEAWDQHVLQDVLDKAEKLNCYKLPWEYGKITPTPKGEELMLGVNPEDIVISQYQASRQNKYFV